jgi:hypothetical protein
MADDDDLQKDSFQVDAADPLVAVDRATAEIQAALRALSGALWVSDRERIEIAASNLVDAWLLAERIVDLFDAPTAEVRKHRRIVQHALRMIAQAADDLFVGSVVRTDDATATFVRRIRAMVAFMLDHGELPLDPSELC